MKQLLERLIEKQIGAGIIAAEVAEVYRYGYMILFEWGLNLIIAGLIGILTGALQTTLIFLISVIPLRSFGGGYHASTPLRCAVISNAALVFVIGLSEWLWVLHLPSGVFFLCEVVLTGYYICHVPVDSAYKPLSNREKQVYAIYARVFYAVELMIMAILYATGREKAGITIMLVHLFVVFSLLSVRIQRKKQGYKEEKIHKLINR